MLKDEAKLARHLQIVMHDWPKDAKQNTIDHVLAALEEQRRHERGECQEIAARYGGRDAEAIAEMIGARNFKE
jgi:NaMN:DMB phosphoribosyltransferase